LFFLNSSFNTAVWDWWRWAIAFGKVWIVLTFRIKFKWITSLIICCKTLDALNWKYWPALPRIVASFQSGSIGSFESETR
jgi:hypothetical protein